MPRLKTLDDLKSLREEAQRELKIRTGTGTKIVVGMGTCGIAAGAREVMQSILTELEARGIDAHVTTVGCIGSCSLEPLVDIQQGDEPAIRYGNVTPDRVPRIVEEHLVQGNVVEEWVVGRVGG